MKAFSESASEGILSKFDLLPAECDGEYLAIALRPDRSDFLVKMPNGAPAFLLVEPAGGGYVLPQNSRYVFVRHNIRCRVCSDVGVCEENFCIVQCSDDESSLYPAFILGCGSVVSQLKPGDAGGSINQCLKQLMDLFRALSAPSRKAISGVWAELFLIDLSENTVDAVRAWHANPMERIDFTSGNCSLEVKASEGSQRAHHFGLAQLLSLSQKNGYVVSFLLERSTGGVTVLELLARIADKLVSNVELQAKCWQVVADTLGRNFVVESDQAFDEGYARSNVLIFAADTVPRPSLDYPPEVSEIRFVSNLERIGGSPLKAKWFY